MAIVSDPSRRRNDLRASQRGSTGKPSFPRPQRAAAGPGRGADRRLGPAAAAARRAAPAWYLAKDVSAWLPPDADVRLSRRNSRYGQRGILWRESRIERVRRCGRVPAGSEAIAVAMANGVGHYRGLQTCGSIWACPVCSAKIRNTRAGEISAATAGWDLGGNAAYMVTLTMPHDAGMKLAALLPVIADGFRSVISGRAWIKLRAATGIVGTIRAVEVTHGVNGWHPHLHVLVFISGQLDAAGLVALGQHVRGKWARFITRAGYRQPDASHGVTIVRCYSAAEAGAYIAKTQDGKGVGNELARADLKRGAELHRTPLEILASFAATGDIEDLALWHEYERATHGRQCITWSKGLRAILSAAPERTDEEIAAEEVGGEVVVMIPVGLWRDVTGVPGLPAAILDAAERGGKAAVAALLSGYGFALGSGP